MKSRHFHNLLNAALANFLDGKSSSASLPQRVYEGGFRPPSMLRIQSAFDPKASTRSDPGRRLEGLAPRAGPSLAGKRLSRKAFVLQYSPFPGHPRRSL